MPPFPIAVGISEMGEILGNFNFITFQEELGLKNVAGIEICTLQIHNANAKSIAKSF
jgi:hypothetical protein